MKRLQQRALDSEKVGYISLAEIQAQSELKQNLIDHLFSFQNYPEVYEVNGQPEEQAFQITNIHSFEHTNYSLSVMMYVQAGRLVIKIDFNGSEHRRANMERVISHLETILEQVAARPDMRLDEIELAGEEEKRQLLETFNDTKAEYPKDKTICALFEEQVERMPEAVAVLCESEQLTYGELNVKANQLAHRLQSLSVGPNTLVGVAMDRSPELVYSLLAVLKAGGAYVPLDPALPQERLTYMAERAGLKALVTKQIWAEGVSGPADMAIVCVDDTEAGLGAEPELNPQSSAGPDHLMYVIYTSGSTGMPKGASVYRRGFESLMQWYTSEFGMTEADRVLLITSPSFDLTQKNIYAPLMTGGQLVLLPSGHYDAGVVASLIERHCITLLNGTPSAFYPLLEETEAAAYAPLRTLRHVFLGGEAIAADKLAAWTESAGCRAEIVNTYGPTECTDVTVYSRLTAMRSLVGKAVPIGRPVPGTRLYILNKRLGLVPAGTPGELCIAGTQVGGGYVGDAAMTVEKFVPNPYADKSDEAGSASLLYRTGDLARYLSDGSIEYLGRIDHQVKIRGYRIEPGEIEAVLRACDSVKDAYVMAREDRSGDQRLVAYVVAERMVTEEHIFNGAIDGQRDTERTAEWRELLRRKLPEYMVPSAFVTLAEMPLSPNGKVDRKALPEPQGLVQAGSEYVAPRSEIEAKLAAIWQDVLGLSQPVGIRDNFFELGGHSLKATQLVSRIQKQLDASVPLGEVFASPTVEELAGYLEVAATKERYEAIGKAEPREWYPASPAQQRLYVVSQLDAEGIGYNIPWALEIAGELDTERVRESLNLLAERHESFRTSFAMQEDQLMQRIAECVEVPLEVTESTEEEAEARVKAFVRPFDLSEAPLLRAGLIRLEEERHVLLLDMHHIISDGTSMDVFVDEFARLYAGEKLAPLAIHYKDYAVWLREKMQGESYRVQEQYWLQAFEEEAPVLQLPTDYARPVVRRFEGDHAGQWWNEEETERLKHLCAKQGVTLYMALLASYGVLLSRYAGQEDVVVGSPVAGRRHPDAERMIGMFVNTLAMRSRPAGSKRFDVYLAEVKAAVLGAMENQDYPFEELVEKAEVRRDTSRNPLFDTMLVLQNMQMSEWKPEGLTIRPYPQEYRVAKFDLTVAAVEQEGRLYFDWEYSTALFKKETVERMGKHLAAIVKQIVETPDMRLEEIELAGEEEKRQLLETFNDTKAEYPKDKMIHMLFEEQAKRIPGAVAVVDGERQLTYGELNTRANRLAHRLRSQGVKPETLVGICMDRSVDLIIGIMGIMKAGGAYVPMDPSYPQQRLHYMAEDAGIELLVTRSTVSGWAPEHISLICLDGAADREMLSQESDQNPPVVATPKNIAYVIYTSGSTGNPKGVVVEHQSLFNMVLWHQQYYQVMEQDRAMQIVSIAFDAAVAEIWPCLSKGASLYLCKESVRTDHEALREWIVEQQITIGCMPTPMAEMMMHLHWPAHTSLRCLLIGGDLLRQSPPTSLPFALVNNYGPTECTVVATAAVVNPLQEGLPPIGRPIANARLYVLDRHRQPVPIGVTGELYIGGAGVARGYLNRPEMTEERFLPDPFSSEPGARMYRTGDTVKYLPDGNLSYVSRNDDQVKIRGFRIELGEIEVMLSQHPALRQVAVIVQEDRQGEKQITAYLVGEGSVQEWRDYLSDRLPSYMVPTHFVQMDSLPLTPNGKIDRKLLSRLDNISQARESYIAPRNATEAKLLQIISSVLGVKENSISIHDSFFALGGHSLTILKVLTRTYALNWDLNINDFYIYKTIEELAGKIDGVIIQKDENNGIIIYEANKIKYYDEWRLLRKTPQIPKELSMERVSYQNVLLLGATGFLGIHLLYDVLTKTESFIHCIVRGNSLSNAQNRLYEKLRYYFGVSHSEQLPAWLKRIQVYVGDVSKPDFGLEFDVYQSLGDVVDAVVNAAAIVKHYGYYEQFEKTNVLGVRHAIDFCLAYQIPLHHVSTTSVSGTYVEGGREHIFTESDFFIGQNYGDNVYIRSKFEAERLIFETNDLRSSIYRVGNLTGRISDGVFQKNIEENMFYLRLKSFIEVQLMFPEALGSMVEFTPVDLCSGIIVDIMQSKEAVGNVFHLCNHRYVSFGRIYEALQMLGFNFKQMSVEEANEYLKSLLNDEFRSEALIGWMAQLASGNANTNLPNVMVDSSFTVHYLRQLGFQYPNLDEEYLVKLLKHMMAVHFIHPNSRNN
ncbi:non-ribosomal peptide synthetase [Paenibacillus sp. BAC0078]